VLDSSLTLRRNLISLAIFNTIFDKFVVSYFFWATLYTHCIAVCFKCKFLFIEFVDVYLPPILDFRSSVS